jgi:hypothetical protein
VVAFEINPNDSKAGGGSCFGGSGGGVFRKQHVLGDASYVNSLPRNATGTYQRHALLPGVPELLAQPVALRRHGALPVPVGRAAAAYRGGPSG